MTHVVLLRLNWYDNVSFGFLFFITDQCDTLPTGNVLIHFFSNVITNYFHIRHTPSFCFYFCSLVQFLSLMFSFFLFLLNDIIQILFVHFIYSLYIDFHLVIDILIHFSCCIFSDFTGFSSCLYCRLCFLFLRVGFTKHMLHSLGLDFTKHMLHSNYWF